MFLRQIKRRSPQNKYSNFINENEKDDNLLHTMSSYSSSTVTATMNTSPLQTKTNDYHYQQQQRRQRRRRRKKRRIIHYGYKFYSRNIIIIISIIMSFIWIRGCLKITTLSSLLFHNQMDMDVTNSNSDGHNIIRSINNKEKQTQRQEQQPTIKNNNDSQPEIIHIVYTRFMQHQPTLKTLAQARLHLFQTFCLPSIIHQTNQNFIWIIKIDPLLDESIKRMLLSMIQEHSSNNNDKGNIFVILSNVNPGICSGVKNEKDTSWYHGQERQHILEHLRNNTVISGDLDLLSSYASIDLSIKDDNSSAKTRKGYIVLETRLDADDGLNQHFIEYIQKSAMNKFYNENSSNDVNIMKWNYWCVETHAKWYPTQKEPLGSILGEKHKDYCITPGLTIGYNHNFMMMLHRKQEQKRLKGNRHNDNEDIHVPFIPHHKLYHQLIANPSHEFHDCMFQTNSKQRHYHLNKHQQPCLSFVSSMVGAVRSRTSTSAGMADVNYAAFQYSNDSVDGKMTKWIWEKLETQFHVNVTNVLYMQKYFMDNEKEIAREGLEGQCTPGHSCKGGSKDILKSIMKSE